MKEVPAESLHALVLVALVAGLFFSVWSAYESVTGSTSGCSVNAFVSCGAVRNSGYTSAFGVPYWAAGVGGFVAMLAVDIPLYRSWKPSLLYVLAALSALGLAISIYFVYLELAVIHAVCPVCTGAHLANVAVLAGAVGLVRRARRPL